jgi:hypothetical protein
MLILAILFWSLVIILGITFLPGILMRGAPYVPTHPRAVEHMVGFSRPKAGECAVDIGSGDGKVVIAMARAGAVAHGYEINPLLVALSRWRIRRAGLRGRAFIHWRNFWNEDFSKFNIVSVYGIGHIMAPLEAKLGRELASGSRVVSNVFPFPNWKVEDELDGVLLYLKK